LAQVFFTPNLQRHVNCPTHEVEGETVRELLDEVFERNEQVRSYIVDEQGAVRAHMVIFVNGRAINDRENLSDAVPIGAEVYIMQALSGG